MTPTRVAMWSGPRNISTAMMRAWENRPDTVVVDEPFYAAFLARTGLDHPAREAVLASQPTDTTTAVDALMAPLPDGASVQYVKHMTHHLAPGQDLAWAAACRNVLLIRAPEEVVASYLRSRAECEPEDIGLLQQQRLLDALTDTDEQSPVIDAADFLRDPESHLRWLCDWLGIGITDRMLTWPAGPRASDGVWAPYWYDAVLASTGFAQPRPREVDLDDHGAAVAAACRPAYDRLHAARVVL
jgi:Sulfotransferase domain